MNIVRREVRALVRIAQNPTQQYPFAVVPIIDGIPGQESTCRSLRDCLIYANGLLQGILAADPYVRMGDIEYADQLQIPDTWWTK